MEDVGHGDKQGTDGGDGVLGGVATLGLFRLLTNLLRVPLEEHHEEEQRGGEVPHKDIVLLQRVHCQYM